MGFSRVASLHLVPLLARIALCIVFVPIGWNKIMTIETFTGEQAAAVRSLVEGNAPKDSVSENGATDAASGEATPSSSSTTSKPTSAGAEDSISARGVYGLAVMLEKKNVPSPVIAAWVAAAVELVGGTLLLVGLLSRIWALGLAFAMGVAFALTSWPVLLEVGPFGLDLAAFNKAAAQIGLGTLAIGVLLGGPGAIAIDHGIFGTGRGKPDQEAWDRDEED
ncbi:MAG: DoxX family membrane protein [Phycisphaera sp.]|nr:DoxX family membrane protein [Phycisphaera sp.]